MENQPLPDSPPKPDRQGHDPKVEPGQSHISQPHHNSNSDSTKPEYVQSSVSTPFGAQLEPALRQVCEGRLSPVRWFRTDWQHGGALTGYSNYQEDLSSEIALHPVVVKLPITPNELRWLLRLQDAHGVVPRVYAHGDCLGGYDMAWVVMEHLPHGPLSPSWNGTAFDLIIDAAGQFYNAAQQFPVNVTAPDEEWPVVLDRSRQWIRQQRPQHDKQWAKVLKHVARKLDDWMSVWSQRPVDQWCHGDLHLANAMTRQPPPQGPAVLIDFALTHAGHWVEDAVYLEHLYWGHRHKLDGRKPCQMMARKRRELGLTVHKNWAQWASIRRAMVAARTPSIRRFREDPHHLQACLAILEKELASK